MVQVSIADKNKGRVFLTFSFPSTFTLFSRNNVVIKEREMHQSFDGTTATLQISSCKVEHAATYKVVISNEFGSDDSEADLKVTEKKKPPEKVSLQQTLSLHAASLLIVINSRALKCLLYSVLLYSTRSTFLSYHRCQLIHLVLAYVKRLLVESALQCTQLKHGGDFPKSTFMPTLYSLD